MWNARTASAADRFDYLYSPDELEEWNSPIHELAEQTERTWVMFNNCRYDYAPRNAREMAEILGDVVAPRLTDPDAAVWENAADSRRANDDAGGPQSPGDDGFTGRLF
jgi:uncharacterized protein YecE (DUF72 family)